MAVSIVSARYEVDHPQCDGRRWVTETIVLSEGDPVVIQFLASVDCDLDAHLAMSVEQTNERLNPPVEG